MYLTYFIVKWTIGGDVKPTWEAAWRAALERFQYQKSLYTGLETPTSSRIGKYIRYKCTYMTYIYFF